MWIRYRPYANGSLFCCCTFLHLHSFAYTFKKVYTICICFCDNNLFAFTSNILANYIVGTMKPTLSSTHTHIIANDNDSSYINNAITRHVWLLTKFNNELWIWHQPHRQKQSGLSRTVHFSEETCIYFLCYSHLEWQRRLKYFLMLYTDLINLYSQYQGCWWPGDAMIHGFSDHDMGLFKPG